MVYGAKIWGRGLSTGVIYTLHDHFCERFKSPFSYQKGAFFMEIIVASSAERFRVLARDLLKDHSRVLEIGCSTGRATRILAENAERVVAVDVSREMVETTHSFIEGLHNVQVSGKHE
ncbi:MAG: methyltransferase domain-containing protein [Candidatus Latescibacteria bacterium]|nr:methyltransferase domain-containing protein [Candidatus Latescibacterota bacterium]